MLKYSLVLLLIVQITSQSSIKCDLYAQKIQNLTTELSDQLTPQTFSNLLKIQAILNFTQETCYHKSQEQPKMVKINDCPQAYQQFLLRSKDLFFQDNNKFWNTYTQVIEFEINELFTQCAFSEYRQKYFNYEDSKGMECLVCGLIAQLINNEVKYQDHKISDLIAGEVCLALPYIYADSCRAFVKTVGPIIIEAILREENPDAFCRQFGICKGEFDKCRLFPQEYTFNDYKSFLPFNSFKYQQDGLDLSPIEFLKELIKNFTKLHDPLIDLDGDGFSVAPEFRGYNWKGKDCNDLDPEIRPGVQFYQGVNQLTDYNCNGIKGINLKTGNTQKKDLCGDSIHLGIAVVGDSAGAHFEIDPKYLNVTQWTKGTFSDLIPNLENEFDKPQKSFSTGYVNDSMVDSLYTNMLEWNRCIKDDYQNVAVNGGSSRNSDSNFKQLRRNQRTDFPVLLVYELIGNDVCQDRLDQMTEPEEFYNNVLRTWKYFDKVLPAGSHMLVLGLVNGTVLYDSLFDQMHPLNITYPVFYDYLNCNKESPCTTYLNSNKTIRMLTAERAAQLNDQYVKLIAENTFYNFDIEYVGDYEDYIIKRAHDMGYDTKDIIEPVDGFHPNQLANYFLGQYLWDTVKEKKPEWIGKKNPHNDRIMQLQSEI